MKFETTKVFGFENAIVGMRLPMSKDYNDALSKSDSFEDDNGNYVIGPTDMKVIKNLINADINRGHGKPNSKVLRMIHVQVAITAPLSFWKEWDTYKVATTANSTSTMHKIHSYEITKDCFELKPSGEISKYIDIDELEALRNKYIETKDKDTWYDIIYGLNDSWLQTRMCDLNYATLSDMIHWRQNHKQNCWSGKDNPDMENFISWAKTLPYAKDLLFDEDNSEKELTISESDINKIKNYVKKLEQHIDCNHTNFYHILKNDLKEFINELSIIYNNSTK